MSFTFVHTADWQLGKRFGGFDAETQALLRDARLTAIDRIAAVTAAAAAEHVLVAGDVFDDARASRGTLRAAMSRLQRHRRIVWHLIPGNHDAHRDDGVFQRAANDGVPDNVRLHIEPLPAEISQGVFLIPAPLRGRSSDQDPTAFMASVATPAGALRIGLAHGSIRGFGSEDSSAIRIVADRANSAGLDFLALGDWHGTLKINDRTWYSGTPEPDNFVANDKGQALVVTIPGGDRLPVVATASTGLYDWIELTAAIADKTGFDDVEARLDRSPMPRERILLRLTLNGACSIDDRRALAHRIDFIAPTLRHLAAETSGLMVLPPKVGEQTFADPGLSEVAVILAEDATSGDPQAAAAARRALELLLEIEAQVAGPEGRRP